MHVIREAQEHHRNVELHLYRKICLLVRLSVHDWSWKKVKKTPRGYPGGTQVTPKGLWRWAPNKTTIRLQSYRCFYCNFQHFILKNSKGFLAQEVILITHRGHPIGPLGPLGAPGGPLCPLSIGNLQHMTLNPFSCLHTNFLLDILKNMDLKA